MKVPVMVTALLWLGLCACRNDVGFFSSPDDGMSLASFASLSDVTPAEWKALAARRIFFGHQSVGANVVQGLAEVIAAHPEVELKVVESKDLTNAGAGFYHATVGRNGNPDEKVEEFARLAASGLRDPGSVGMVKYCYVDVLQHTDPNALFASYRHRIEEVKAANPDLTIVHFTMPLTVVEDRWTYWKRKVRGWDSDRDKNIIRNRYNALLRSTYAGREPVFDIAALESMRPDGSAYGFRKGREFMYVLAPELTADGAHLNEAGRRMMAEQLVVFLAKLPIAPARSGGSPAS